MLQNSWTDIPETFDSQEELSATKISPEIKYNSQEQPETHILIEGDNYPVLQQLRGTATTAGSPSGGGLHVGTTIASSPSQGGGQGVGGRIDIIYIDPPYTTGNAFTYNDDFSSTEGRHDAWLSFMNRRLAIARDLLADSGAIFIAIDQSELYVLKLLCDKIFGEENFVNDFMWLHGKGKKDTWSRTLQQHTLCYAKNKKSLKPFEEFQQTQWATKNADNDPRGNWFSGSISFSETRSNPNHKNYFSIKSPSGKVWTRQWQCSKVEMNKLLEEKKIYWGPAPDYKSVPRKKIFNDESTKVIPRNIIDCVESTRAAQGHLDELLGEKGVFDNPKPVDLITHLLEITNMGKDSLVLDFFGGSGTTLEAVCELNARDGGNRKAIIVQKAEPCKENQNRARFATIFDICKARCEKVSSIYSQPLSIYKLQNLQ